MDTLSSFDLSSAGLTLFSGVFAYFRGFIKEVFNAREEEHSLSESGFILLNHKSTVSDFYCDKEVTEVYYPEMAELVKKQTGASEVFIVSHITRNEEEAAQGKRLGAHRLVHNDFTPQFKPIVCTNSLYDIKTNDKVKGFVYYNNKNVND